MQCSFSFTDHLSKGSKLNSLVGTLCRYLLSSNWFFLLFGVCKQAEKQLNSSWVLMRAGNLGVPTPSEWLNTVLAPGCRIGIDPVSNAQICFQICAFVLSSSKIKYWNENMYTYREKSDVFLNLSASSHIFIFLLMPGEWV